MPLIKNDEPLPNSVYMVCTPGSSGNGLWSTLREARSLLEKESSFDEVPF